MDTRPAQMERAAHYLTNHPDSTAKEIDAAIDTGCITKVLSDMRVMGYGIRKGWRDVRCARHPHAAGTHLPPFVSAAHPA